MTIFDHIPTESKDSGSAKTKGECVIEFEENIAKINTNIEVIKSGMDGTAYGEVVLIGQQPDGNVIFLGPVLSKTVGAKIPEGVNKKSDSASFRAHAELFQDPTKLLTWWLCISADETIGVPRSIPDLKKLIIDNVEFVTQIVGIALGSTTDIGNFKVIRTKIR